LWNPEKVVRPRRRRRHGGTSGRTRAGAAAFGSVSGIGGAGLVNLAFGRGGRLMFGWFHEKARWAGNAAATQLEYKAVIVTGAGMGLGKAPRHQIPLSQP